VDPGLSGAIALVGRGRFEVRRDFKTLKDIADGILELLFRAEPDHLIIEQVGAMPGQGVCSMFSFGKSTGVALGALWAKHPRMTIEEVHPIRWQNWFRKTCNIPRPIPFDSQALAAKLLPAHAELFTARKKDHNTADAVLIGLWKLSQP
jgi:crossover junction endodeoxyribonuclease RuvC